VIDAIWVCYHSNLRSDALRDFLVPYRIHQDVAQNLLGCRYPSRMPRDAELESFMSDYRPYDYWDYRVNDLLLGEDEPASNRLLDEEGNPLRHPGSKTLQGLAAIAAALHKYGLEMRPEHLEKAVWWLKDWKMHRVGWWPTINASVDLHQSMQRLKESVAFKKDGALALRHSYISHFFALFAGIVAAGALAAWFGESGWGARAGWTVGFFVLAAFAAAFRDSARDIWQKQDRRYFLQCLRLCKCTEDPLDAGLFAFHPKPAKPEPNRLRFLS